MIRKTHTAHKFPSIHSRCDTNLSHTELYLCQDLSVMENNGLLSMETTLWAGNLSLKRGGRAC